MAVYIDSYNAPFGRMIMCHMMADTTDELIEMANKIGVARKWIQKAGTEHEHFDICLSKKKKALALGAVEVGWREMVELASVKRKQISNKQGFYLPLKNVPGVAHVQGEPSPELVDALNKMAELAYTKVRREDVITERPVNDDIYD